MERKAGKYEIGVMTIPAVDIDTSATLQAEIDRDYGYADRMNEPVSVIDAAIAVSSMCMSPAISEIAMDVLNSPDQKKSIAGWNIEALSNKKGTAIDMLLTQPGKDGAWHLGVEFKREMSEIGKERKSVIDKAESERYAAMTPAERRAESVNSIKSAFGSIIGKLDDPDFDGDFDDEEEVVFDDVDENFRNAERGDKIVALNGTALVVDGKAPKGISRDFSTDVSGFWKIGNLSTLDVWWLGVSLSIKPEIVPGSKHCDSHNFKDYPDLLSDLTLEVRRSNCMTAPEILKISADLIDASGYSHMVRDASKGIQNTSFWNSDVLNSVDLAEIGIGSVLADEGFYGKTTQSNVETFTNAIAALNFSRIQTDIMELIKVLDAQDFETKEGEYSCNDGRTTAYLTHEDAGPCVHAETQNGNYSLALDEKSGSFTLTREDIGDFLGEFAHDGSVSNAKSATYGSDNIRGLNDVLSALQSLSHCIQDEYEPDESIEP